MLPERHFQRAKRTGRLGQCERSIVSLPIPTIALLAAFTPGFRIVLADNAALATVIGGGEISAGTEFQKRRRRRGCRSKPHEFAPSYLLRPQCFGRITRLFRCIIRTKRVNGSPELALPVGSAPESLDSAAALC